MTDTTKTKAKSWRDVLPIHPAAELLPPMTSDELKALGEDIKQHGLRNPVTLWVAGGWGDGAPLQLLDGRSRLDAAELVGLKVVVEPDGMVRIGKTDVSGVVFERRGDVPWIDPYTFVLSANLHRRHLTSEQKRELIAKVLKAQPAKSNRIIAKQTKADDKTVGKVRRELEGRAEIPHVDAVEDTKGRKQPTRKTAKPKGDPISDGEVFDRCKKAVRARIRTSQQELRPHRRGVLIYAVIDDLRNWAHKTKAVQS